MPIFEYQSCGKAGCRACTDGFERLQKSDDAVITRCPECGGPVQRILSAPNISRTSPSLSPKNLERHGFTQYRKAGSEIYEKTAGKGPRTISKK